MNHETYRVVTDYKDLSVFRFTSEGKKGKISKVIFFMPTDRPDFFALPFGDMLPDGKIEDDRIVTNNGDRNKVLATIVQAVNIYKIT